MGKADWSWGVLAVIALHVPGLALLKFLHVGWMFVGLGVLAVGIAFGFIKGYFDANVMTISLECPEEPIVIGEKDDRLRADKPKNIPDQEKQLTTV